LGCASRILVGASCPARNFSDCFSPFSRNLFSFRGLVRIFTFLDSLGLEIGPLDLSWRNFVPHGFLEVFLFFLSFHFFFFLPSFPEGQFREPLLPFFAAIRDFWRLGQTTPLFCAALVPRLHVIFLSPPFTPADLVVLPGAFAFFFGTAHGPLFVRSSAGLSIVSTAFFLFF